MANVSQEFVYSWYDGITGVVTQPHQGWDNKGASGLASGVGKGIGGLLIKPQAGRLQMASLV